MSHRCSCVTVLTFLVGSYSIPPSLLSLGLVPLDAVVAVVAAAEARIDAATITGALSSSASAKAANGGILAVIARVFQLPKRRKMLRFYCSVEGQTRETMVQCSVRYGMIVEMLRLEEM